LFSSTLCASRCLLAAVYSGPGLVAVRLPGIHFFHEALHILASIFAMKETEPRLPGWLCPVVIKKFLSAIDLKEAMQKFSWPGWLEAGSLRLTAATVPSCLRNPDDAAVFSAACHL
jgi:hypothetical protein